MIAGGDDYELAFTAPPPARAKIEALGRELGLRLSRVGEIRPAGDGLRVLDAAGAAMPLARGFDHFAA